VTPRELWKASGHRAGSPERADKADLWRSFRLQLAIVVFAAVIMLFVLLGTILNNQGGTKGTPVFPWEWGQGPAQGPAGATLTWLERSTDQRAGTSTRNAAETRPGQTGPVRDAGG
jgi:hypothetical protein